MLFFTGKITFVENHEIFDETEDSWLQSEENANGHLFLLQKSIVKNRNFE